MGIVLLQRNASRFFFFFDLKFFLKNSTKRNKQNFNFILIKSKDEQIAMCIVIVPKASASLDLCGFFLDTFIRGTESGELNLSAIQPKKRLPEINIRFSPQTT